jgi:phytoene synthase
MDTYTQLAYATSARMTAAYSTSFSLASRLFPLPLRQHIYNIYGLVRLADEIVDTYRGPDQAAILDALEKDTYSAIASGYSSNLIVHAFARTAQIIKLENSLIEPFFASMRRDIIAVNYDETQLEDYIYGSAEVVGLMCLRAFTEARPKLYIKLKPGAQALGAAFQKVNFLRDLAVDHDELGRVYFPGVDWASFDDATKKRIEKDIDADFARAHEAIVRLPYDSRPAVQAAYEYYVALLERIRRLSAVQLKTGRVRLPNTRKLIILGKTALLQRLKPAHDRANT